jgi:PleD family two-component response regulator
VHALHVSVAVSPDGLQVEYTDPSGRARELSYAADELDALRRSAVGRRNGRPLRRILILQASPESASRLLQLLVAEFAVQSLPTPYARAIAATREPPDLVVAQLTAATLDAIRTLRTGAHTRRVPLLVLAGEGRAMNQQEVFSVGADDVLQEPILPAQLRARIRTLLLRGHA